MNDTRLSLVVVKMYGFEIHVLILSTQKLDRSYDPPSTNLDNVDEYI